MFRSTYTPIDFNWALDMKIPRGARVQQIKLVNFYPAMAKQNNKPYPDALLRLTCGVLGLRKSLNAETPYSKEECTGVVSGLPSKLDAASATLKAEKEEIDYTRNLDVHQLDPTLPSMRLEDWLRSGPAGIEKVNWRPSPTCDLKDPEPLSTDKNDWATCVKFLFAYRGVSESAAYVEGMITVGTVRKGITGPPRFEHFGILDNGFFYRNPSWVPDFDINKLSALFRALAELSSR
jgi:hypothetical protein